jgi:hypothetical protein
MKCCNIITDLITGVVSTEDPSPPLTSAYCIQWSTNESNLFFPCVEGADVNGNTNTSGGEGSICQHFSITDFDGVVGNTFYYDNYAGADNLWYAQVIRPNTNPALADLGYYAYDVFGNIVTNPIPATNSNCTPHCYTATVNGIDITTDGLSEVTIQEISRETDIDGDGGSDPLVTFDTPNIDALYKTKLITHAGFEPDCTVTITINSPTSVTIEICSLLELFEGAIGNNGGDFLAFNFIQS